jgi:hypothetical protein
MLETYHVRLLSNDGRYPAEPVVMENWAVLVPESDCVWSAVHSPVFGPDERREISWLSADEIRFFAAISLSEREPYRPTRPRLYARSAVGRLELP